MSKYSDVVANDTIRIVHGDSFYSSQRWVSQKHSFQINLGIRSQDFPLGSRQRWFGSHTY